MVNTKALFFSHSVLFVGGFVLGKLMDKEELDKYRDMHETTVGKFRKTAEKVALGMLLMGTFIVGVRVARAKYQ